MRGLRSPDALVLCALLLLLAVLSLRMGVVEGEKDRPESPRRSIASARPGGWKGLRLLLERQGFAVTPVEREPRYWPEGARVLVTGEGYEGGWASSTDWSDKQVTDALRWVAEGRTLLLLVESGSALLKRLKLEVQSNARAEQTLFPLQPAPFLAGVDGLRVAGKSRWRSVPPGAVPLFADNSPAVVALPWGKGVVVAVSDAGVADNKHLALDDNARFLLALLRIHAGSERRVAFDEFRQGYQAADTFWDAVGRPGQLVAWQILGLVLLLVTSAGRRFGLPRPLPAPPRVSSEYVTSLADLYRRARAADAALEGVYLSFWRDLCRSAGRPYDAPTDEVVTQAARALTGGDKAAVEERLRRVVNECEAKIDGGGLRDSELVPLARELEALRKQLGMGGDTRD